MEQPERLFPNSGTHIEQGNDGESRIIELSKPYVNPDQLQFVVKIRNDEHRGVLIDLGVNRPQYFTDWLNLRRYTNLLDEAGVVAAEFDQYWEE